MEMRVDTGGRDWLVRRHIGDGASSSVYAVEYTGTSTQVPPKTALKIVSGIDPTRIEATIAAYRRAPSSQDAIEVYDLFEADFDGEQVLVFMLELASYSPEDVLKYGSISTAEADVLCARMLRALEVYHAAGLVHGDVKPSNILWCDERWKLGAPDALAQISHDGTATAGVVRESTLDHRPQESLDDPSKSDGYDDLWALAVTLNEAAGGQKLNPSRPDRIPRGFRLAPELSPFIAAALGVEAFDRPQHVSEVDPGGSHPEVMPQPVIGSAPTTSAEPVDKLPVTQGRKRFVLAAMAFLLVAFAGLTVLARATGRDGLVEQDAERPITSTQDSSPDAALSALPPTTPASPTAPSTSRAEPAISLPVLVSPVDLTPNDQPTFVWESVANASRYLITVDQQFFDQGTKRGVIDELLTPKKAGCARGGQCEFVSPIPIGPAFRWWLTVQSDGAQDLVSARSYVLVESQRLGNQ